MCRKFSLTFILGFPVANNLTGCFKIRLDKARMKILGYCYPSNVEIKVCVSRGEGTQVPGQFSLKTTTCDVSWGEGGDDNLITGWPGLRQSENWPMRGWGHDSSIICASWTRYIGSGCWVMSASVCDGKGHKVFWSYLPCQKPIFHLLCFN